MNKSLKLHLGCGYKLLDGYVNVDKFGNPDLVLDLETFPWPWEDNSVDEIIMHHVLEHLGQETQVFLNVIQELYRICKHNTVIDIRVPHPRNDNFIIDPTHVRIITPEGLNMFSKKLNNMWKEQGLASTTLGLYLDIDFEVHETTYIPRFDWNEKLMNQEVTNQEVFEASTKYNNVFEEICIKLVAIKE